MIAPAWLVGVLLMTVSVPPTDASDPPAGATLVLADFKSERPDPVWYVVNDNVMGGRSEGDFRIEEGELHFAGRTNTDATCCKPPKSRSPS